MEPQQPRPGTSPLRAGDYGYITYRMVQLLRETRPWVRLLAGYGFLASALMLLGALALMVYAVTTPGRQGYLVGVGVGYALISIVTLFWAFPLHRYASSIRRIEAGGRERALEEALAFQKDFWRITGIVTMTGLALLVGFLLISGFAAFRMAPGAGILPRSGAEPSSRTAPDEPSSSRHRAEDQRQTPSARTSPYEPSSPGATLGLDDLEKACGDIRDQNFLCLVNQGTEVVAGGAREVVTEARATFHPQTGFGNSVSISVEGKKRYRIEFGPPKGKALIPGLYTGAERWPFNEGLAPGLDITIESSGCNQSEGQFRILEIEVSDGRVRRFVADFDGGCRGATSRGHTIGRIAVADDTPGPSSPG